MLQQICTPKIRGGSARCWLLRALVYARGDTGMVTMTEVLTHDDRAEQSNGAKRNGAARVLVTAGALAAHLSCVRSYIAKLVDQGILERRSDGRFDQDQCRAKYIAHLKEERKRPPRSAADTEFVSAKSELIRIRILEKKKALVPAEEAYAQMDQ